jgi:hypothetical protein
MKIKYKYKGWLNFETLKNGDVFMSYGTLYIKCQTYHKMNAVRVEDGCQDTFTPDHSVVPVNGVFVEE